MLTSEDVSLFWDRFTTWVFSQRTETVLLLLMMGFFAWSYWRLMDDNESLRREVIQLSRERLNNR